MHVIRPDYDAITRAVGVGKRLDADDPNTLYVTWTLKDGTKKLDAVKFRKVR